MIVRYANAREVLRTKFQGEEVREYLLANYLVLYKQLNTVIHLLSIKRHRQLSFDFDHLWAASQSVVKSLGK